MAIDEEELKAIIKPKAETEEISSISSDGRNLLTRIPKRVVEKMALKKGETIRWLVDGDINKVVLEVIRNDIKKEKIN